MNGRAVIIVLDSVGIGGAPDALKYGDVGANTLGNIASFLYNKYNFEIEIITDTGHFYIIREFKTIQTSIGQPISLFCIDEKQRVSTKGLKYKLENDSINLYNSTLNIAEKKQITISLKLDVPVLVYLYCENEKN